MATKTLHMRVGENIGKVFLDIVQSRILDGDIDYAMSVYPQAFGMTDENTMMILKNEMVVVANEDGTGVELVRDKELLKENAHNIFDWHAIINNTIDILNRFVDAIIKTKHDFNKYCSSDIENYSIIDYMQRFFTADELNNNIGLHTIAARIIGSENSYICDTVLSSPQDIWDKFEGKFIGYENISETNTTKWEKVLYLTVQYNKLIKILHQKYMDFEKTFLFLTENNLIERPNMIEATIEKIVSMLWKYSDKSKGYNHPLCNTGLCEYKNKLAEDLLKTVYGKEYIENGMLKKNILDGYDAGWLSPDGEFYGGNGDTSSMIHMNIAEQIFNAPTNKYAIKMKEDGVSIWGGTDSPDYWLEKHGWVKIHHDDCYGSFIGHRNEEPTKEYPYHYNPTDIQIKMICDYADKFYGGKFYTEANAFGRMKHTEPFSTYAVRQMDEFKIHEIFRR